MSTNVLDLYTRVLAKADTDDDFRQRVLANGTKAVEQEFGAPLPDGVTVTVEESARGALKIVLPPKRKLRATGQLSDADLQRVSGGAAAAFCICIA